MSVPAYARTWVQALTTGVPGIRIPYVSLLDLMQNFIYGVKTFQLANGYSHWWSASGGTGPANAADHTDRITSAATWTPQAAIAGASQAWVVLKDGNANGAWTASTVYSFDDHVTNASRSYRCINGGVSAGSGGPTTTGADITDGSVHWKYVGEGDGAAQFMICFQGATADVCRISYSPGALFTLAGTTNQQPTATDECIISSGVTIVGTATSADRVWHGWMTADGKNCRFCLYRSSVLVGSIWGLELFTPPVAIASNVSYVPDHTSNAMWGFCFTPANVASPPVLCSAFGASSAGGLARMLISSVAFSVQATLCSWTLGNGGIAANVNRVAAELQGASGFTPWPLLLLGGTATTTGYIGAPVDWYLAYPTAVAAGDGFGPAYDWVQMIAAIWPNPSQVAPTIA